MAGINLTCPGHIIPLTFSYVASTFTRAVVWDVHYSSRHWKVPASVFSWPRRVSGMRVILLSPLDAFVKVTDYSFDGIHQLQNCCVYHSQQPMGSPAWDLGECSVLALQALGVIPSESQVRFRLVASFIVLTHVLSTCPTNFCTKSTKISKYDDGFV